MLCADSSRALFLFGRYAVGGLGLMGNGSLMTLTMLKLIAVEVAPISWLALTIYADAAGLLQLKPFVLPCRVMRVACGRCRALHVCVCVCARARPECQISC